MRGAARLEIDRQLRSEPLEEFTPQEVTELAEGVRDRVYASFRHRQEIEARRTQEKETRKRVRQCDEERAHAARIKKKTAYLDEAHRRVITVLKTRAFSPLQRLQVLEDMLTQLDATLTGDEQLSEAYASINAILQARVADWDADEVAQAAKQQEEWWEIGAAVAVILSLWFMYAKGPDILLWIWKILAPEPAAHTGSAPQQATETPPQSSEEPLPQRPVRRIRRGPRPHAAEPPSPSSLPDSENRTI